MEKVPLSAEEEDFLEEKEPLLWEEVLRLAPGGGGGGPTWPLIFSPIVLQLGLRGI